jgi:hypothetical protein
MRTFLLIFLSILLLTSCQETDTSPKALVNVFLTDAPAQWDSVLVEILGVELEFVQSGRSGEIQKFFLPFEPEDKQIDVASLVAGNVQALVRNEFQIGQLTKVSLRIGSGNSLFVGDKRYDLPSASSSQDIPVALEIDLEAGISYDVILDFDLEKSIQLINNDPRTYAFNPTISAYTGIGRGQLRGTIAPSSLRPAVYAVSGTDTLNTHTNTSGAFTFRLAEGSYTVFVDPKDSRYLPASIPNVVLEKGKITTLERITLSVKP